MTADALVVGFRTSGVGMGGSKSSLVSTASKAPEVSLTGADRGVVPGSRGNAARVEECGLSRVETPRGPKEDQVVRSLDRLGTVQAEAIRSFADDAKVESPPPFSEVLADAFLETAIASAVGGVAGSLSAALMVKVTPVLKERLDRAGAVTLAAVGKFIEDATKDGLKQSAREARALAFAVPPPFFELSKLVEGMQQATSAAWFRAGMEFLNQASGLSEEDLCTLIEVLGSLEQRARALQYASAAGAWARYLGEARNLPPTVGASSGRPYERLEREPDDGEALRLAAMRGAVAEIGFDPRLMLHVQVRMRSPRDAAVEVVRWPGMSPQVCQQLRGVAIRDLGVPLRVYSENGVAFDLDAEDRVFRNLSSGEGREILRALGEGRADQWHPGQAAPGIAPGTDRNREAVDRGASTLAQGWILGHALEPGRVRT